MIIDNIISSDEKFIDWEKHFKGVFRNLVLSFQNDYELQLLGDKMELLKESKNILDTGLYDFLFQEIETINGIISYIENITNDSEIVKKLDKYKDIKLDYTKSLKENIDYVDGLLKEILKLKLTVELIYSANKYLPKIGGK